jgi:hypothetical protein
MRAFPGATLTIIVVVLMAIAVASSRLGARVGIVRHRG